jgi:hypothetical protein
VDELLFERVKQLRAIDERLDDAQKLMNKDIMPKTVIFGLRNDLADMIREAERQHAEF